MTQEPEVKPLPYKRRKGVFRTLLVIFVISLPFLFLYAKGYRLDLENKANFISTGGIYVAAERTDAEIFIDNELVQETRIFRTAFYAPGLQPGTHKVSVQKENSHTWVKELPVYAHLVTDAQAFNLPLVPQLKIISPWQTKTGDVVLSATSTLFASTTNQFFISTSTATSTYIQDTNYSTLVKLFATSSVSETVIKVDDVIKSQQGTTTVNLLESLATSTKEWRGVRLHQEGEDVYARWVGAREDMPYYYCAKPFEQFGTSTELYGVKQTASLIRKEEGKDKEAENIGVVVLPPQTVSEEDVCRPEIRLDRKWQTVNYFDFFPGSVDFVILVLDDGVYVVEVDDRSWQNVQPLVLGEGLDARVENGNIYVYDGKLIYQVILSK